MVRDKLKLITLAVTLAVGLTAGASGALAQSAGAKAAMMRHEKFEEMGRTFKALNDELKKGTPDKAVVLRNATAIKTLSTQLPTWFPRGSGKAARPKSEAKAEIWTDAAGFSAAASNFQVQASKLQLAAASGDMSAVQAQVRATGGSCGGCHKKYRDEKK